MKNEFKFELEILEPRFEFKPFFEWLWDAVCWLGESAWDIVQGLVDVGGVNVVLNPDGEGGINPNPAITFPGLFSSIWENWEATWAEYWVDSSVSQ